MSRSRRRIVSGDLYEMCFRARSGIPFPPSMIIKLLLKSALARTQRDFKMKLVHIMIMGNHIHLFAIPYDVSMCSKFCCEVQKKLTDYLKCLLGVDELHLWEGRPTIAKVLNLDYAIERIAYFFANPAAANLVDNIEQYPGLSSYQATVDNQSNLDAIVVEECPWIRQPTIAQLPTRKPTGRQDCYFANQLRSANRLTHDLILEPNAWMKCFGITSSAQVKEINERILESTKSKEAQARELRVREGKMPMGAKRLLQVPIMAAHKPKKKGRKIYVLSSIKELRINYIREFKEFCRECRRCYEAWKAGQTNVVWPPGAFRPPMPPLSLDLGSQFA